MLYGVGTLERQSEAVDLAAEAVGFAEHLVVDGNLEFVKQLAQVSKTGVRHEIIDVTNREIKRPERSRGRANVPRSKMANKGEPRPLAPDPWHLTPGT